MWREFYNLNLKISHLVVNGCSYTYGHGIEDPINDSWASIVAKRLGVPLVNLALPGQGNTAIYRRTMQYFYKDLFHDNNPFYIHAYTQSSRREAYHQENQEFRIVGGAVNATPLEKEIIITSDEHYYCLLAQDKLHRWTSINNLLDIHNVSHFSTDYMPECDPITNDFIDTNELILKNELDSHPSKLQDFNIITKDFEKTTCLHETEEGHKHLADYIWKEIETRYDDIEVINLPYAKLHDILICPPESQKKVDAYPKNAIEYYPMDFSRNVYYMHELGLDYINKWWLGKPSTENNSTRSLLP